MTDNLKLDVLLSDNVLKEIKSRIIKHHELYDQKISSTLWEETLHKSFVSNNLKSSWKTYGHQSGTDVECEGVQISCKSGVVKGKKIKKLVISSYRTTSLKTIEEKVDYLDQKHEDIIFSLVSSDDNQYKIYVFTQPKVKQLDWKETKGQWRTVDENTWNEFKISKSMSDQFWMNLSLDHWNMWGVKVYDL